jgi:hypothetical protein
MYQGVLHSSKDSKNKKQRRWCESGIGEKHFGTRSILELWDTRRDNHNENTKVEDKYKGKEMQEQIVTISSIVKLYDDKNNVEECNLFLKDYDEYNATKRLI